MVILKQHYNEKDTIIYGNAILNGYETFYFEQLEEFCKEFDVFDKLLV